MKIAVPVKTTHPSIALPEYQTEGSAGFDLATDQDYMILPQDYKMIGTGLVIHTPPGHMMMVAARSSLYKKHGLILTNSVGIVDEDYSGDDDLIYLSLKNVTDRPVLLLKGERVAQGIFVPITRAHFQQTTHAEARASRGGWGSTDE